MIDTVARRHIAILTLAGNGHVYPVLPLCSALAARGYRVTYPANEHYARAISQAGGEPVPYREKRASAAWEEGFRIAHTLPCDHPDWWTTQARFYPEFLEITSVNVLAQVLDFYRHNVPDLVVYDRAFAAGRVLAWQLGVAAIQISPSFALYRNFSVRQNGVCRNPKPVFDIARSWDRFLESCGIRAPGGLWHAEPLNVHLIPKEFQHHADAFGEGFCFVGSLLNRAFQPRWTDLSGDRPIVLVSDMSGLQGAWQSPNSLFRVCLEALADSECHCILSIGEQIAPESLGAVPENFEINQHASHLEILPHAAVSVCHGGMGTTLEALYHGVPVIAAPTTPGTAEVAWRVQELGVGMNVSRAALTPEAMREHVGKALHDASLRNAVMETQRAFRRAGGAAMAADRIEQYLAGL